MATFEEAQKRIEAARNDVIEATRAYRKGGSPTKVNRANDRLADAQQYAYECAGGIISKD